VVEGVKQFAVVWVPFFAAAAEERCDPQLRDCPLGVVTGAPPAARITDANAAAREQGVAPDMTETEARARCPSLVTRPLSQERLDSARRALLDAAHAVSPRVEDGAPGLVDVDVAGLERLVGDARQVGEELVRRARVVGFTATVGVADRRAVARVAARLGRRVSVVAPGSEAGLLAGVRLAMLDLPDDLRVTLAEWGVRTLGELAVLPRDALAARLGAPGLHAHDMALGIDRAPFRPWSPPRFYQEAQGLEWEVDSLDALVLVLRDVLGRLCARLEGGDVHADALTVQLGLAGRRVDERQIVLASPIREAGLMLTLAKLDLEAHPPGAPVTGIAVSAHVVRARVADGRLWDPPAPASRDLASVLARVAALVGPDSVGAAEPMDTHRPDAFVLVPFAPPGGRREHDGDERALALRRLRPPRGVVVETTGDGRPARIGWDGSLAPGVRISRVVRCAGPWRRSGAWWDAQAWARDEWDASLPDGIACRLVHDRVTDQWSIEGIYD
jgi:protein ImuB